VTVTGTVTERQNGLRLSSPRGAIDVSSFRDVLIAVVDNQTVKVKEKENENGHLPTKDRRTREKA
jgi:hypothetical protein